MKGLVRSSARRLIPVIAIITLYVAIDLISKPVDRTEESVTVQIQFVSTGIRNSSGFDDGTSDLLIFEFNDKLYCSQDSDTIVKYRNCAGKAIQCKRIIVKSIFGSITESFVFE